MYLVYGRDYSSYHVGRLKAELRPVINLEVIESGGGRQPTVGADVLMK